MTRHTDDQIERSVRLSIDIDEDRAGCTYLPTPEAIREACSLIRVAIELERPTRNPHKARGRYRRRPPAP